LQCATSDPTSGGAGCPISRAAAKQDIKYVTPATRAELAEAVNKLPLATYRYKRGDSRQHLGFIIEDVEPSASIDSERGRVDLYGYVSMAVAALQEQNAQIGKLEAKVEKLEEELKRSRATKSEKAR
jgi:hypothetical protein